MDRKPICTAPWTSVIFNGASVNCCCFYTLMQERLPFPSDRASLMDAFNSQGFQDIRKRILNRDIAGTPCETCLDRQVSTQGTHTPDRTPAQLAALRAAEQSAAAGEIVVSHTPVSISLNTCTDCNLRCLMCYNSNLPADNLKGSLVPYEDFIAMLEDMGLQNLTGLTAVGGEPFLTKDSLEIIRHLSERQDLGVLFSTNTNGTLLHNHKDILLKFRNLALEFSIEGFEDTYESIRRGASWRRVLDNFEWYAQAAKQRPGWFVGVNSIIMKTSLPDMKRVIELARGKAHRVRFTPIMGDYFQENIFQFPDLVADMPWQRHFDEAIEAAKDGFPDAVQGLKSARRLLEQALSKRNEASIFTGSAESFESQLAFIEAQCPGQEVAVLGTRDCLADFLAWCRGRTDKRFTVASRQITDTGRPYAGWPTAPLERLPQSTQSILLCCRTYEFADYSELAARLYPQLPVRTLPFWDEAVLQEVERLAVELAGKPVVLYAAGGTAEVLLRSTGLAKLAVVAFSDGNPAKHGTTFLGKDVVPPAQIPALAADVVILSENYSHSIAHDLAALHGDALRLHRIF